MSEEGDMRQAFGELKVEVRLLGRQMTRFEIKLDCVDRRVAQHRTGWQIFVWIGGVGIALAALFTGFWKS